MDTNTIIEGTVKFRDGKKWKSRWCVVRKLSPVADCIHLQLYRDCKERYKHGQTKASLSLENFLGIQSGFTVDKESNTLAIICQEVIVVLAFDTREHLMQWQVKITSNLGEGDQFLVQISSAPSRAKLALGPARLLIQEYQFCLTVGVPPRLISFWQIKHLRKFGVVEGKFCFEGGSRCGRGEGLYVLVSEKPEELTRAFHLAAEGKLSTRKHPVARNMSVMEKVRKHHTLRPESQLSDVSSLDSTIIDSQQGSESNKTCGSCSQSHEDLLSWPLHFPDTMSTCESHRFDLKPYWSSEVGIGRCTSCMSKLGSMSRSSTLTNTPGSSSFPAWTMDRPKSCGSGKMSSSVTCSSISLSSHSSRGSSCGNDLSNRQHLPASDNSCACRSSCATTPQTPPSRPPKPAHLSLLRLQATPVKESPSTPSSPHTCCCSHPATSPYGNYDIPKPLTLSRSKLKLDLKGSPVRSCSTPLSAIEFYDTPRKLKDSLNWDFGNYDIPPPAQPFSPSTSQNSNKPTSRGSTEDSEEIFAKLKESLTLKLSGHEERPQFQINKVKLTGEGRMPVMSPCGKIIERPEPTYEERLESLLENDCNSTDINKPNSLYANIAPTENCNNIKKLSKENLVIALDNSEQNYSNIELIQSLENYENFKCFLPEQNSTKTVQQNIEANNRLEIKEENQNHNSSQTVFCSKCSHACTMNEKSLENYSNVDYSDSSPKIPHQSYLKDVHSCSTTQHEGNECAKPKILNNKCNSTSCLQEIKNEPNHLNEKNEKNRRYYEVKTIPRLSNSVTNSPDLKRITRLSPKEGSISARFYDLSLRKRSNSADSARLHIDDESVHDTNSTDSHEKSRVLSNPSSTDSLCAIEKIEDSESQKKEDCLVEDRKRSPLIISEKEDLTIIENPQHRTTRHFDTICARRSASVPNKFFSNRDSSSSNDSGVSTGSLSLKHFCPDFLEFEMPLTTSMSSKRHHIAVLNGHVSNSNGEIKHIIPKRSKSVDPLRDLAFTFELGDQQNGKSTSAEAEVPMFLIGNKSKDYLSPQSTTILPDSRSTSSGTSDMSDYFETLSFSSFSSLDAHDNIRNGRASIPTMKPRSGNEYQKIDRYLLEQETKE